MRNEEFRQQLEDLENRVSSISTGGGGGTSPTPCAGGIMLTDPTTQERFKKRLRVSLCVTIPAGTTRVVIVAKRVSDIVSEATYNKNRLKVGQEVEESVGTSGGDYSYLWAAELEYGTQYRVIRIIAIDADGNRSFYPATEQAWNDAVPAILLFTTPEQFGAPSGPSASLLFTDLDPDTIVHDAYAITTVYAPLTDAGAAQTWGASGVDSVHPVLKMDGEVLNPHPHVLSEEELTQIADGLSGRPLSSPANRGFVKIRHGALKVGRSVTWAKNVAYTNGERKVSSGSYVFTAGARATDPNLITGMSLTITQTNRANPKFVRVVGNFTQPSPTAVAVAWARVRAKLFGAADSTYEVLIDEAKFSLQRDDLNTPGVKTVVLDDKAKLNPSLTWTLEFTIKARQGGTKTITQNVSTGLNPDVANDTAAPTGLSTPVMKFVPREGVVFKGMTVTTDFNNPTKEGKYVVISNGGGLYFNIGTYIDSRTVAGTTDVATARFPVGLKVKETIGVSLSALRTVFGVSGIIFGAFYAENKDFGLSIASPLSLGLSLANARDNQTESDAVTSVSAGVIPPSQQIFKNGDLLKESAASQVASWFRWDGATYPIATGGGNFDISNVTANLRFNRSRHSISFTTPTQILNTNIQKGRVQRAEKLWLAFLARANTVLAGMTMRVRISANDIAFEQIDNDLTGLTFIDIALGEDNVLTTSYVEHGCQIKLRDDARLDDGAATIDQFFLFQLVGALGGNEVEIFRPVLGRGVNPGTFALRAEDDGQADALVTEVTAQPEVVVVGEAGGGFDFSGEGGIIRREQLTVI